MKPRFDTFDIICSLLELQKLVGMRLNQVYDIDNKTYLLRFQRGEEKCVLLLESGTRFHITQFEWPKNDSPSGFSMKLRKHLRNKRLEAVHQLGVDRIVSFQFGTGEAAYYVILELYDRGNILLADKDHVILNILRYHVHGEDARFAVREKYPLNLAKQRSDLPTEDKLREILRNKDGENLKKVLNPHFEYGPTILEHVLLEVNLAGNMKVGKTFIIDQHLPQLLEAFSAAERLINEAIKSPAKGYIIQKKEERASGEGPLYTYQAFHPSVGAEKTVARQHAAQDVRWFDGFNPAVDEYFSSLETQKIDLKAVQQERDALRKLQNVQRDHDERVSALEKVQLDDKLRGELITRNQAIVDAAIMFIRRCIAAQLSWDDIGNYIKEAAAQNDPIALLIKDLKLNINHITLLLSDPYAEEEEENSLKPMLVDIDLDLSAFANAKKYFDAKRSAAKKQQKTIESVGKALKSAEKKTKQALKEVQTTTNIIKARKVFWFEKFFWFISSENYLVVAGRDQIQNEIIVKRYLRENDIYVHADISGASSVVIKNPTSDPVPPKTLNEAGVMAVCYSVAWDAKVLTGAYWVNANQVSKTAPTGEYLTTGSFMIRGKKNYLLPAQLAMGFSFLFKLEESSVSRHKDERKVRQNDELEPIKEEEKDVEMELELSDNEPTSENIDEEKKEELIEFPDTELQIQHSGLNKVSVKLKNTTLTTKEDGGDESSDDEDSDSDKDEQVVYLGDNEPVILKPSSKKSNSAAASQTKSSQPQKMQAEKDKETKPVPQIKRGQRSKMKKIKEKYKDQDEEERKLKMLILQSAGTKKETKKDKKKNKDGRSNRPKTDEVKPKPVPKVAVKRDGDEEEEEVAVNDDVNMLCSLTGQPHPEDELLFAIPVIAPYAAVSNYKYKVKLTPGTGKRGKAANTALALFLKDKLGTPREKECLKSVKSQDLAKNIPGKVKVSAPNIHKHR
ncbi:ribosome quality control complex subunit NEMF homolog [Bemisia tabaci]|uniref:ribosome quality control complex subunit NEMF homolog n=1 Tax=Bemisia tabaci TaxID=7038 RepID=UPI003B2837FD